MPTRPEIIQLHKKYAPGEKAFDRVFSHCQIVWEIAEQIVSTKHLALNATLVQAGALLHDIGAYKFISPDGIFFNKEKYIQHGILGYEMLKQENLSESICRFPKYHTGVGIPKQQIIERDLPLPLEDYFAETIEERLVMYADKFHSKTPTFHSFETYRDYCSQFGKEYSEKFETLSEEFGKPDLLPLAQKYKQSID